MAITKLPRSGIADDAVNADKIQDGTLQAVEITGTITNAKLKDGEIANAKLSNSSVTVRGTSISLGGTHTLNVNVDWQSKITSDGSTVTTMVAGRGYFVDNSSAAGLVKLPTSASIGDTIAIKDYAGNFGTNNLTIQRNGHKIQGAANDSLISTNRASIVLVYVDTTKGWLVTDEHNVDDLGAASYTSATGGTVTTVGDFKLHVFTGDGCFVVSQLGNSAGGGDTVGIVVVAGGGGGGADNGAGGGAGGLIGMPNFPISATTFPITVGGGGVRGETTPGDPAITASTSGSNSTFSTITSVGGGGGAQPGFTSSQPGGSGGGASRAGGGPAGGNGTQGDHPAFPGSGFGNNGGSMHPERSGGGGGAGSVGGDATSGNGGNGGTGKNAAAAFFDCTPAPSFPNTGVYAGGGSASNSPSNPTSGGAGRGAPYPGDTGCRGEAGTANTGGGGGAGAGNPPGRSGGAGGKGIVVIRYKFQN